MTNKKQSKALNKELVDSATDQSEVVDKSDTSSYSSEQVDAKSNNSVAIFSKPNPAIMSLSNLSRKEKLYANICLAIAQPALGRDRVHKISLEEFRELADYDRKDYAELKRTLKNLMTKVIEIGKLDDDDSPWKAMTWLAEAGIENGMLTYEYSTGMEQVLKEVLDYGFTKLDILIQKELKSKHSMDLYEIGKRFARVKSTGWKPYDWWRKAFNATSQSYSNWNYFYRDILKPSMEEVNAKSDLILTMYKRGRPVTDIRFAIECNTAFVHPYAISAGEGRVVDLLPDNEQQLLEAVNILKSEFGITSEKTLAEILDCFEDKNRFIDGVNYLNTRKSSRQITSNLSGYAYKTLINFNSVKNTPEEKTNNPTEPDSASKELDKAYSEYVWEATRSHYDALTEADQSRVQQGFLDYLNEQLKTKMTTELITEIEEHGLLFDDSSKARVFAGLFRDYYLTHHKVSIETKEDYLASHA